MTDDMRHDRQDQDLAVAAETIADLQTDEHVAGAKPRDTFNCPLTEGVECQTMSCPSPFACACPGQW